MNYTELHKLIDEYGLKEEGHWLIFKSHIVAYMNNNLIDNSTREIAYCLKFTGYVETMNYELSKKYTEERIKLIKEKIIRNKKYELEQDFKNEP
ncbi:MAG: hypothetical protein J6T74_02190 [Clostridia bacterium]|nr:hypothetical protein [Clostridia bacterium]